MKTWRLPAMCTITNPTRIRPVTAMIAFLPIVDLYSVSTDMRERGRSSEFYRRHRLADGVCALRQRGLLVGGEGHLDHALEPLPAQQARHAEEEILHAVLALE